MQISRSKTTATAISLFLILAMAISLVNLPVANAQTAIKTYAFLGVTPNPVGVGQTVLLHIGISQQTSMTTQQWKGLTVTVTRPDDTTETLGPFNTDSTGGTGTNYIPTKVGTYQFQTHFPAQSLDMYAFFGGIIGTFNYAASDSSITYLVVQTEPIPYFPGFPLPTEYWTRPINAQFYEWVNLTGNWLRPAGSYTMPPIPKLHSGNSEAPETAHILWTTPYAQGGLTGGDLGEAGYEMGDAYVGKFLGSVIIDGVLYFNRFQETGGTSVTQEVVAMNLKTGEELWVKNWNNTRLAFGQVYNFQSFNYYGAFAYLWTTTSGGFGAGETWDAYDALTGRWLYRLTDVPSGYNIYGPKGEIYRYTVDTAAGWMTEWNSSRAINPQNTGSVGDGSWTPIGSTINATQGYDWNVSIPLGLPGAVAHYSFDNRVFGSTSYAFPSGTGPTLTSWAISTKKGSEGQLIFNKTWTVPQEFASANWVWCDISFDDGIFIISCKESLRFYGFSLDTGAYLWQTEPEPYLAYYDKWYGPCYGYGNFYSERMSGMIICYDIQTGKRKWTYNVTDKYAEILWSQNFPTEFHFLADGKIYLSYAEHSPNLNSRGAPMVCLNATTGEEIWTLSWFNCWWGGHVIIGDSIMAGLNAGYDNRIYAIGKGPSATTVEAPMTAITAGDSAVIQGTVTDISPGTEKYALRARFPNGVAAVADNNMTAWMEYVYMQYPYPANVIGVEVTLDAIDSNGNFVHLGTATSDTSGTFSYAWTTPDIPGEYTIIATFAGSKSYVASYAETAAVVTEAPPATPTPTPAAPLPPYEMYTIGAAIAIIIAVAIATILILRKRP